MEAITSRLHNIKLYSPLFFLPYNTESVFFWKKTAEQFIRELEVINEKEKKEWTFFIYILLLPFRQMTFHIESYKHIVQDNMNVNPNTLV
jgi:nicotinamide riboside transporter PnuC